MSPAVASLGLHEGIAHPPRIEDPRSGGCLRWPEGQWLLNQTTGQVVPGRCKATNLCRYCQALYVLETVEMLSLDAAEHAPTLYLVITAREHLTRADLSVHLRRVRDRLRSRWPSIEWFDQVEFQKRGAIHANLLVKGVPADDVAALVERFGQLWCGRVDAEMPWAVRGDVITEAAGGAEGVVRYIAKTLAHGLKAEQAPPIGWRGHRTSQTRGYLVRPAAQMREEARAALRLKRELWRAREQGHDGAEAEAAAELALTSAAAASWRLWHEKRRAVEPTTGPAPVPEVVLLAAWAEAFDAADVERS